ncbi:MAG: hypothetical protein KDA84_18975 [Planctomycetaceae bacterium]|nr:hypothetical protein [Planctomycetaceae bacterium]
MNAAQIKRRVRLTSGLWSDCIPLEELQTPVLNPSDDFWDVGSQDINIRFTQEDFDAKLIVMYSQGIGFYVMYGTAEQWSNGEYLIAVSSATQSRLATEIWVGGDKATIPRRLLIAPEECWEVVATFWETGDSCSQVHWEPVSEELYCIEDA